MDLAFLLDALSKTAIAQITLIKEHFDEGYITVLN